MYPTLFEIGGFSMPSYFFFIAVGFILAVLVAKRDARRVGIDPDDVIDMALWGLILGVAGSRLLHVVADGFFMDYVNLCLDPFQVEGRDLWGRPLSELTELGLTPRRCVEDAQCYDAMTGGEPLSWWSSPKGYDVGPVCNEATGLCHPERDCFRWAYFWSGGLVFYGAFLAAASFGLYFTTKHRSGMLWAPPMGSLPRASRAPVWGGVQHFFAYLRAFPDAFLRFADLATPTLTMAMAFGRTACFLAGCCFGEVTYGPTGVVFPGGSPAHQLHRREHAQALQEQTQQLHEHLSLPVHPTQLYEVGALTVITLILFFYVRRHKRFHGEVFAWMLALYGAERFVVEFFRADYRGEWLGLSTSQLISAPLVLLGCWLLWRGLAAARLKAGTPIPLIDDGQWPPLGRPLTETVYAPRAVRWGDAQVAPVEGWRADLEKLMDKVAAGASWKEVALGRKEAPKGDEPPQGG